MIASEGADNRLTTGTLVAEDLANRESWSASQTSLGASLGFGGGGGSTTDGNNANSKDAGTPLSGIRTALGTVSATMPTAPSDSGSQQGTTYSAIAAGTQVTITSGDAASLAAAQALSRDTAQANAGSLVRVFDEAKREEIALGFEAAQLLSGQVAVFLANRAQDAKEWDAAHKGDPKGNPYAIWGASGAGNIVLTALNGAASGQVTGSVIDLVRASAVNVLQSLAVSEVKRIADRLDSEEARTALQALTACGGAVASGQGDCGGAALGAAASVVLNKLFEMAGAPKNQDLNGDGDYDDPGESLALEEQQARTNLVATLTGAIAEAAGLNTGSAVNAALIETNNNALVPTKGPTDETRLVCTAGEPQCQNALPFEEWSKAPKGSSEREEYDDIRAVLGLNHDDEDALNVLKAIYWGQVPIKDALVYIMRGYSWEQASSIWQDNKSLGEGGVFSPLNTSNWNGYLVESGDTLSSILVKIPGMRMADLLAANPTIDPNAIDAGQIIRLPTQDFIDSNNAAKLTFVRLNHYLEQTGGIIPDGVNLTNLPAFEGEDEAVANLNAPADKLAAAWVATYPSVKGPTPEKVGSQASGATPYETISIDTSKATLGTPEYEILNNPPPNTIVTLDNGTTFRANEHGFVEEITYLPVNAPNTRDARQTAVGKEGFDGDVGGHIQACRHGGTCDRFNLIPQNANFNNSAYKAWENELTKAMQNGDDVGPVTVRLIRVDPKNPRPDSVRIKYSINGEVRVRNFRNEAGG